ncbi:UNVERIFIED_CONTAM: hypothetical protein PYX00_002341 [Menopon gallinae]|uniref:Uncharacterized protein n=1 Tax=Menopon gallinae TaxID=328185 RepID=A0AAW2IGL9_9NEOP
MHRKVFPVILLLAAPIVAGPVPDGRLETHPDIYGLEDSILQLFERLRQILKYGSPDSDIPPLDPLNLKSLHFDFYLEDTELKGYFKNTVIKNLSCFEVTNVTASLRPKMELKLGLSFEELFISGFYRLFGSLFGDLPIDGIGSFSVDMKNFTLYLDVQMRTKAGIPQIKELSLDFQVQNITVKYQNIIESNEMKTFAESFVKSVLDRFKVECLPPLLNMLKVVGNDFLVKWFDSEEYLLPMIKKFF